MSYRIALLAISLLLPLLLHSSHGDVFTAMVDLENLLISEAETTSGVIEQYIRVETERLQRLRDYAEKFASQKNSDELGDVLKYVSNPVNAYLLIKKLNGDWKQIKNLMLASNGENFIQNITQGRIENAVKYPDDEDLDGAATALLRLQDTYALKTDDLANGIVAGENVGKELSAQDCFEVARAAYNNKDYYHCLQWSQEAIDRMEREPNPAVRESDVLEYLAYSLYQQGNAKRALVLTKRLAKLDPNHPRAAGNVKWYEDRLALEDRTDLHKLPPIVNERDLTSDIKERTDFEKLCRGEFPPPDPKLTRELYCYLKRDRPYLRLAPIKVEILRHNPLVVLFRQVLADDEIEVIKHLATPRLKRATVQNSQTGELEFANYRISKSAWLKGELHPVINRVNRRIDLMTNLNQETSEELQVANYGIGGHYDPHFDFARKEETNAFKSLNTGNRIATVLFYMSQPDKGGATVYTDLRVGARGTFPSMHDALFWYNLNRSGEGDLRTRHAACPVLTGIKWVSNKWIHERGQEFRRPCGLAPSVSEKFVGDLSPM